MTFNKSAHGGHLNAKIWVFGHILGLIGPDLKYERVDDPKFHIHNAYIYVPYKHAKLWPLASFFNVRTGLER